MKYSSLLLQFYLYFISYFLTLSLILGRPLNTTHHFQTRIHDSVLVQNSSKNSECGSSCSTHKVWGLLIKNEASVEGVAPELFPMKKMRYNLYVLSTGWITDLTWIPTFLNPFSLSVVHLVQTMLKQRQCQLRFKLSLWFWGQVLNLLAPPHVIPALFFYEGLLSSNLCLLHHLHDDCPGSS